MDNDWKTELKNCNICGISDTTLLWKKDSFHYVQCNQCGLVYINPHLKMEEVQTLYKTGFQSKVDKKKAESTSTKYNQLLNSFDKYKNNNRILDIGCFNGAFLNAAKKLSWTVYGTEISADAVELAKINTNGGDIRVGELEDISFPADYFDVITMRDVIEHLPDPNKTLKEIHRILRTNGLLYFDTPNFNSLERFVRQKKLHTIFPWHFYYFTSHTISRILMETGYNDVVCFSAGFGSFSTFNPLASLKEDGNIAQRSNNLQARFIGYIKKIRVVVIVYRLIMTLFNYFFQLLSKIGINFGAHLIVNAKKPIINSEIND